MAGWLAIALRTPPHADAVRHRLHPDLAAVRHGHQPGVADLLPRAARAQRRRPAAAVAIGAAGNLPAEETRHRDGGVRPGHHHRAHHGADARRLDHRQLHLALDLLHQSARGHPLAADDQPVRRRSALPAQAQATAASICGASDFSRSASACCRWCSTPASAKTGSAATRFACGPRCASSAWWAW